LYGRARPRTRRVVLRRQPLILAQAEAARARAADPDRCGSIALKTLGGIETIAREIQDDPAIRFAAVIGSFARGGEGAQSDVDVFFVIDDQGWKETDLPRWLASISRSTQ